MTRPLNTTFTRLGAVVQALTLLGALFAGYASLQSRLAVLETRLERLQQDVTELRRYVLPASPSPSHPGPRR